MSKKLNINDYLPQIQKDYEKEIFERVAKILEAKGIVMTTNEEMEHIFRERIKKSIHEGITTLSLDGNEFVAYGPVHASVEGKEIKTSYKFAEI